MDNKETDKSQMNGSMKDSPLEKECLETICETVMKWLDGFAFTGIE